MAMTAHTWTVKNFVSTRLPLSEVQYEILYGLKTEKYTAWRDIYGWIRRYKDADEDAAVLEMNALINIMNDTEREYVVDLRINHDKDKGYILCRTRR